ncbi:MAG: hypothetical protein LBS50_10930 [Prevotellaceae bacterium]|jgi:hypothetical protein|nr:hypothetical protein [Prevotellaceae bacterium]
METKKELYFEQVGQHSVLDNPHIIELNNMLFQRFLRFHGNEKLKFLQGLFIQLSKFSQYSALEFEKMIKVKEDSERLKEFGFSAIEKFKN